jgi:hypothetical protein
MDQSTEEVASAQPEGSVHSLAPRQRWHERHVTKSAVRTVPVVVLHIDPQHTNKLVGCQKSIIAMTLGAEIRSCSSPVLVKEPTE